MLLLTGIISYNYTNTSYAKWSSSVESKNTIKVYVKSNLDESGANEPMLADNMIPVYYDETNSVWKKADYKNSKEQYRWYDYNNKMWANAVTVTSTNRSTYLSASAGTEISMDDINTMWVWIPRYTYTYLNTNKPEEIKIEFESGSNSSGTIKCADSVIGKSSISETCTDNTNGSLVAGTSTYTHPAFWWDKNDDNIRTDDEELTGIWVGKFEISSDTTCTAGYNDSVGSGCNLQTIRPLIKPNIQSWRGAQVETFFNGIYNMKESGNQYGFSANDEIHMMKNMEWGAVAYLSHSKYGINKEVALNSVNTYITGCGPQSEGSTSSGSTCNGYTTTLGQSASSTGNISGVYDMSGGAYEYMMGNMVNISGQFFSSRAGFSAAPAKRYYDSYSYDSSSNKTYTRGKLGDATKEMAPTGIYGNWYDGYASFPRSSGSWFVRGGYYSSDSSVGLFYFVDSYGISSSEYSGRSALALPS